ncbi:hypothetical protein [Streptomyces huasconensis]|uniref:hypothetical protein n=1 Tax=Streptomyces huasconensis TaxID=1854574 RepID=UPI0036F69D98
MGLFRRREQVTRAYPNATSVTGDVGRFRRHKTAGARAADRQGQAWEDRDRAQDRRGGWYRPAR